MGSRRSALRCSTRTARFGCSPPCIRKRSTVSNGPGVSEEASAQDRRGVQDGALRQSGSDGQAVDADLEKILAPTLTGMTVEEFNAEAKNWPQTARHPRYRPYTELIYQPMLEVLNYFRDNAYKTDIVACGGQDFVRVYAEKIYGVPLNRWSALPGRRGYGKDGKSYLTKDPKLLVNDDNAGKPEGIFLMIDRRP
jgi:hypothetical protein